MIIDWFIALPSKIYAFTVLPLVPVVLFLLYIQPFFPTSISQWSKTLALFSFTMAALAFRSAILVLILFHSLNLSSKFSSHLPIYQNSLPTPVYNNYILSVSPCLSICFLHSEVPHFWLFWRFWCAVTFNFWLISNQDRLSFEFWRF